MKFLFVIIIALVICAKFVHRIKSPFPIFSIIPFVIPHFELFLSIYPQWKRYDLNTRIGY